MAFVVSLTVVTQTARLTSMVTATSFPLTAKGIGVGLIVVDACLFALFGENVG